MGTARSLTTYGKASILDGTYPAGQPLPSEEVLAKQLGVSRPTVRQGIAELRAAGLVEVMMGRGMFVGSPHSRSSPTRPRGVRREPDSRYVEADGLRWDDAEEPVAIRTDTPLALADLLHIPPGEPMYWPLSHIAERVKPARVASKRTAPDHARPQTGQATAQTRSVSCSAVRESRVWL